MNRIGDADWQTQHSLILSHINVLRITLALVVDVGDTYNVIWIIIRLPRQPGTIHNNEPTLVAEAVLLTPSLDSSTEVLTNPIFAIRRFILFRSSRSVDGGVHVYHVVITSAVGRG